MEQKGKRIQAVEKAVLLMDVLWKERRELSLAELGKLTQMAKSSIHITLMTLMDSSLLHKIRKTANTIWVIMHTNWAAQQVCRGKYFLSQSTI